MPHFQVHILSETSLRFDGRPMTPAPHQSIHEAALDLLHHQAQLLNTPVHASVTEGPGTGHFVLEVSPDGSSRLLEDPEPEAETPLPEEPEPEPDAPLPEEPTPPPPPRPSALASVLAQARARATALTRLPPPPPPLSSEVAPRIARINALSAAGHLDEAFAEATALREELTTSLGTEHPHALEARAIEAYLAYLRGDHREATVLALAVARIRCGAGDPRAAEEVARAAAAWQRLDDDHAALVHGRELLHMWDRLRMRGLLPPAYTGLVEQVTRHVKAIEVHA